MSREMCETIIRLVQEKKPESVEQLVGLIKCEYPFSEPKILECILRLIDEGKITLHSPAKPTSGRLSKFLKSQGVAWYWTTVVLSTVTLLVVFTVPENDFPLVYIRYVLGTLFVLFIPGYSFVRALFPKMGSNRTSEENLSIVERLVLSVGFSLAFAPIIGVLLDYTPYAMQLGPIVISLLTLTAIFATIAAIREHGTRLKAYA